MPCEIFLRVPVKITVRVLTAGCQLSYRQFYGFLYSVAGRHYWSDKVLVVFGLTAVRDSISVYIGPSPREREKEERKDR